MKQIILTLLLIVIFGLKSFGAVERFKHQVDGTSGTLSVSSSTPAFTLYDDKFYTMATTPSWGFYNSSVTNTVRFGINPDVIHSGSFPNGNITVKINAWKWNSTLSSFDVITETKTLYLTNSGVLGTNILEEISSYRFTGAHKIEVYLTAKNNIDLNSIYLAADIEVERFYPLDNNPVTGLDDNFIAGDPNNTSNLNLLEFAWDYKTGAEYYELEWVHISSATINPLVFKTINQLNFNYYLNSTRVVVKGNKYTIPSVFDNGFIVYRVRPIGLTGSNYSIRKEGVWSNTGESGLISSHNASNIISINNEFQSKLNWSHQIAYSDNGERYEGIMYADGLGRSRQTLSINPETGQTIVSNVYYDELGRPVVADLPSPVNGIDLKQKDNFNQPEVSPGTPYNYSFFDASNSTVCDPVSMGFATSSGAGKYYSTANNTQTGANLRVPDAEKFPFSRAVYADDFTGRLKTTSGAGPTLKTGSGHETQYFYPDVDQNELDRLFGAEVGHASHYSKMVTIDPNGQIYIQIFDMAGRIVASYLAGANPQQLDIIEGNGVVNQTVELLPENSQAIDEQTPLATFSHLAFITTEADYEFVYGFTPSEFQNACMPQNVCLECVYDLNFKILNDCGDVVEQTTTTLNGTGLINVCGDETPYDLTFTKHLPVGEYQIVKTLTVSTQIMEDNWCLYLENNSCLSPISSYFNQEYLLQTFPECTPELSQEDLNSCQEFLQMMLADLSPGGQYAEYNIDPNTGVISLISGANSIFNPNGLGAGYDYQHPYSPYLDANGNPSTINGINPKDLSLEMFISNFQPSWANSLLNYHPEYCNYNLACNGTSTLTQSNDYDELLNATFDYDTAFCNGYFKPLVSNSGLYILPSVSCTTTTVNYDPFFASGGLGAAYASAMNSAMQNYEGSDYTIWQMAVYQAYCGGQGDVALCLDNFRKETSSCYNDLIWVTYRNMYLEMKQGYVYQAIHGTCPVSPILSNGNHTAVFGDMSNLPDADGDGNPENGTGLDLSEAQTYLDNQITQNCQTQCTEYADDWLATLGDCDMTNLSATQLTALRQDLINLCTSGCDVDHPTGSSTSPSGTTIQDILTNYGITQTNLCTGYLISEPLPFKSQEDMIAEVSIPLDTCACSVIHTAQYDIQYGLNNPNNFNLEQLIAVRTGVSLEDAHYLLCACDLSKLENGTTYIPNQTFWQESAASVFASTGIQIPATLGCESSNCTDCETISNTYNQLLSDFSQDPNFLTSSNYSVILTNYLNQELGFQLSYVYYSEFMDKCASSTTNPYCYVTEEALEWLEVMKLITFRGSLTASTAVNLTTQNIVFANSEIKNYFSGSDYWTSLSGSTLTTNWGQFNGTSCTIALNLPLNATFNFSDIVSFDGMTPLTEDCGLMGDFIVSVTYLDCGELKSAQLVGTSSCLSFVNCVCGPEGLTLCDEKLDVSSLCYQPRLDELYQNALNSYQQAVSNLYTDYMLSYKSACSAAFDTEDLTYTGPANNYQYTLYYYDQAGNLVKTVAPQGIPLTFDQSNVDIARNSVQSSSVYTPVGPMNPKPFPVNTFESTYKYNSYDQIVSTTNPDQIGETKFWYDRLGRLVASQNPVQADDKKYSYVLYDQYGRPIESGQADRDFISYYDQYGNPYYGLRAVLSEATLKANDLGAAFKSYIYSCTRSEVTYTIYDKQTIPGVTAKFAAGTQQNLRFRVASVVYFESVSSPTMPTSGYVSATHYSYDIHGNVIESLQDVPQMALAQQDIKSTQYQFELLSGNVKKVDYQKGKRDNMTHEYVYDKVSRLTEVFVSTDGGVHKSREAHYRYFDYGPLARVEIGQHKVQGNDFSYTINGWLKSMNGSTLNVNRDAGKDGVLGYLPGNQQVNAMFAQDATAYTLGYFANDYNSIMSTSFLANNGSGSFNSSINHLYNGNIAYTTQAITGFLDQASVYTYDQLHRITGSSVYRSSSSLQSSNSWQDASYSPEYATSYSYDKNGNFKTLNRNGVSPDLYLDIFNYKYVLNSNRLTYVTDASTVTANLGDIKYGQSGTDQVDINNASAHLTDNYQYDKIGQLVKDVQEGNQLYTWRKGDKKLSSQKSATKQVDFVYNPFGQRICKIEKQVVGGVVQAQTASTPWIYTYYGYDANGQVMATYKVIMNSSNGVNTAELDERMIYGAARIGVVQETAELIYTNQATLAAQGPIYINKLGKKNYELSNYLGNVNAVITDRKVVNSAATATLFNGTSTESWTAGTNVSPAPTVSNGVLNVTTTAGANNFVQRTFTTNAGTSYQLFVKTIKGTGVTDVKVTVGSVVSNYVLVDGQLNIINFVANTTGNILVKIQPTSTTAGIFKVDEVVLTPQSLYEAVLIMKADYYPFGMQMPAKLDAGSNVIAGSWQTDNYRYGYNGMEKDKELKGDGNSYTTEFRQYDPRLGRWLSLDPAISSFPWQSPYCAMDNNPVLNNDPFGDSVRYEKFRDKVNVFFARMFSSEFREEHNGRVNSNDIYTYRKRDGEPILKDARNVTDFSVPVMIDGGSLARVDNKSYVSTYYDKIGFGNSSGGGDEPDDDESWKFPKIKIEWLRHDINIINKSKRQDTITRSRNTTTLFPSFVRLRRRVDGSDIILDPRDYPDKFTLRKSGKKIYEITISEVSAGSGLPHRDAVTVGSGGMLVPNTGDLKGPLTVVISTKTRYWPLDDPSGKNSMDYETNSISYVTYTRWRGINIHLNLYFVLPKKISIVKE